MKRGVLFILFALNLYMCNGQADSSSVIKRKIYYAEGGLIGSLIYPGAFIGGGILLNHVNTQKRNGRELSIDRYASSDFNWYHHPQFNDNVFLTIEWRSRRTNDKGFFYEFSAGPGISRTFTGGTVYSVSEQGLVHVENNAGYTYALLTTGEKIGFNSGVIKKSPLAFSLKMSMIVMFPYNSTIYVRPLLQAGISFSPGINHKSFPNKR